MAVAASTECPSFCSGHGKCSPAGKCVCKPPYYGDACELRPMVRAPNKTLRPLPLSSRQPFLPLTRALLWQAFCRSHCSGHGRCELDAVGTGHCICDEGFAGATCNRAVPSACRNNCGGHGACLARGQCACDAGFGGADCSILLPPPAGRVSLCKLGCSGRGLCGPSGECICSPGISGAECTHASDGSPPPAPETANATAMRLKRHPGVPTRSVAHISPPHSPCPGNCSGHGECHNGGCVCHAGHSGLGCERVIKACPHHCSGHGSCDAPSGRCECHPGYAGDACEVAMAVGCPYGCSSHGTCQTGAFAGLAVKGYMEGGCECRDGMAPPACAYATGTKASRVAAAVAKVLGMLPGSGGDKCPFGCSGRGHCRGSSCVCVPGFTGAACELATARCPADCNGHGQCVDGFCQCAPGWQGVECSMPSLACGAHGCGGHGTCVAVSVAERRRREEVESDDEDSRRLLDAREGVCQCHPGWTGPRCETFALPPAACLHNCSGRGTCQFSTGECSCAPGYTGRACELVDTEHGECPSGCCGHGTCVLHGGRPPPHLSVSAAKALGFTEGRPSRRCECEPMWTGSDCCTSRRSEDCPHGCSGNGRCVHGVCQCDNGWSGAGCSVWSTDACPHACSAHGRCRRDGTCDCEAGFSGVACEHGDAYGPLLFSEWHEKEMRLLVDSQRGDARDRRK